MVKGTVFRRILLGLAAAMLGAASLPASARAEATWDAGGIPDLASFAASVKNGNPQVVRGVYAEGLFALAVVQQPSDSYVSKAANTVTQFDEAAQYGVVGLLAHDYLSGRIFFELRPGQSIQLIYGDGRVESFWITYVYRYQATQPRSVYSDFIDLNSRQRLDADSVFREVYMGPRHVTFQACIARDGNLSWGRLFVVAMPGMPGVGTVAAEPVTSN